MFSGRSSEPTIWGRIGWWVAEIVVVFLGVYLAFLLEGYRADQQDEQQKQQVYTALHNYFSLISPNIKRSAQYTDSAYVDPFLEAYQNDEMPRLEPLPYFTQVINESTWRAMLQSGAIDLLDASFILQVDNFFVANERLRQETMHVNRMQDRYLLPNANADITTFYNSETKRVKPLYQWYVEYLKSNSQNLETMKRRADTIIAELERKLSKERLENLKSDSSEENNTTRK
jgi:hypothetical protein